MKYFERIRRWIFDHELFSSVILVVFLSLVTFLPSAKNAGFYVDDYHMIFAGHNSGPEKIRISYMVDRPAAGYLMEIFYRLFGSNVRFYQFYVIILNIVIGLSFIWIIRKIWPNQKAMALISALLAVVYPGFVDWMHAFNYSMILTAYSAYIFSILITLFAITHKNVLAQIVLIMVAMILTVGSQLLIEYYLGLEIVRLGLIYLYIVRRNETNHKLLILLKTIKLYLPYLIISGMFVIWRFLFFSSNRSVTNLSIILGSMTDSPFSRLVAIVIGLPSNFLKITLLAWFDPLYRQLIVLKPVDLLVYSVIGLFIATVVFIFFKKFQGLSREVETEKNTVRQVIFFGCVVVLVTSVPIIFVNRAVTFEEYGRYTLPGMFGGILILAAFINFYAKQTIRPFLVSLLVFSGVLTQLGIGKSLAIEWQVSKDLWWQLSWRAPSLKPGTALTGIITDYPIGEGFYFWGPANMIYYPQSGTVNITAETLNSEFIKSIQLGSNSERNFRSHIINVQPENLLILSKPTENSCLHLINGSAPDYSVNDPSPILLIGKYSKLEQVDLLAEPMTPPTSFFGPEPAHKWCYYFQKADLAVQKRDFNAVVELWADVVRYNLQPVDRVEFLPFVIGFAEMGEEEKLNEIIPEINERAILNANFCSNLAEQNYALSQTANQLLFDMSCKK